MSEVAGQALPSGTLTFLFTDIEGSTGLAQELGPEGYGDVLVQHRELLRAAWAAHGGTEVGTEGDSFFVVFAAAPAAVAAGGASRPSGSGWGSMPASGCSAGARMSAPT